MENEILKVIGFTLAGGALYRWRGHASKYKKFFPRPCSQIAFALPYAYEALAVGYIPAAITLAATTAAILTGHGQYFPDMQAKPITTERLDVIVRLFFGEDPRTAEKYAKWRGFDRSTATTDMVMLYDAALTDIEYDIEIEYGRNRLYWRCAFGMTLKGLAVVGSAALFTLNPWLLLSGLLMPAAYLAAYRWGNGTAHGEWFTGFWMWGLLPTVGRVF